MMNYYKISRSVAQDLGISLFAHWVCETKAVVSDMDLRSAVGFDLSAEELQERFSLEPLDSRQMAAVVRDSRWELKKD